MRWTPGDMSDVEDRRGGGGGGFSFGRGPQIGCGGAIVLLVLSLLTGRNLFTLFDGSGGGGGSVQQEAPASSTAPVDQSSEEERLSKFAGFVMKDAQDAWAQTFQREGIQYQRSRLVLYRDVTPTACGTGDAATGPFYCPGDGKVYLDLGFFEELDRRFEAPGDFAQAYVIAHEIGHHVQNLTGTSDRVHEMMQSDRRNANRYSVQLELQADCYAGIWGKSAASRDLLDPGDIEEGLSAAAAVGDDRIQEMSGRAVNPESFSHGSSEQRMEWFQRGFQSGDVRECDTFK